MTWCRSASPATSPANNATVAATPGHRQHRLPIAYDTRLDAGTCRHVADNRHGRPDAGRRHDHRPGGVRGHAHDARQASPSTRQAPPLCERKAPARDAFGWQARRASQAGHQMSSSPSQGAAASFPRHVPAGLPACSAGLLLARSTSSLAFLALPPNPAPSGRHPAADRPGTAVSKRTEQHNAAQRHRGRSGGANAEREQRDMD